jgi:hypothetical protein
MPEIMIGGYAPLARPALDCLWMEAPEDGGSSYAIEKPRSMCVFDSSIEHPTSRLSC